MWHNRKLMIVSILAVVALLITGIIGVTAFAQDGSTTPTPAATTTPSPTTTTGDTENAFISKVASILGLDEETVADAFSQAKKELKEEALKSWLDKLVANGKVTQAEADEYLEWMQSKPDIDGLTNPRGMGGCFEFGGRGGKVFRGGMMGGGAYNNATPSSN